MQCLEWNSQERLLDSGYVGGEVAHVRVVAKFVVAVSLDRNDLKTQTVSFREKMLDLFMLWVACGRYELERCKDKKINVLAFRHRSHGVVDSSFRYT